MNLRKIGKLLPILIAGSCISLKAPKANAKWININPYSCVKYDSNAELNSEFLKQLDQQYTENINFTTSWESIKKVNILPFPENGIEADLRIGGGIYVTGNHSITDLSSSQSSPYVFIDSDYNTFNEKFQRTEKDNIKKTSYGLKLKHNKGDFRFFSSLTLDDYVLEGNADVTIVKGPPQNPSAYTQWSNATYNGRAQGFSASAGLEARFIGPLFLYFNASYSNATINTFGEESVRSTTAPNPKIYDYSPVFNWNDTGTEAGLKILIGGSTENTIYMIIKPDGSEYYTDNKKFWKIYKNFHSRLHKDYIKEYGEDENYSNQYKKLAKSKLPSEAKEFTIEQALEEAEDSEYWGDYISNLKALTEQ